MSELKKVYIITKGAYSDYQIRRKITSFRHGDISRLLQNRKKN